MGPFPPCPVLADLLLVSGRGGVRRLARRKAGGPLFRSSVIQGGRVAPGLAPWRSHRSGRATSWHPVRQRTALQRGRNYPSRGRPSTPEAIQRGCGDRDRSHKVLPLVPPAGSARWQRPSLHRVLRGEFPGFHSTMALCDSLCPWRWTRLPSPSATLRRACRFAPVGPGRPTAGLGFMSRSPLPATIRREADRASQVPGKPRLLLCHVLRLR